MADTRDTHAVRGAGGAAGGGQGPEAGGAGPRQGLRVAGIPVRAMATLLVIAGLLAWSFWLRYSATPWKPGAGAWECATSSSPSSAASPA